MSSKITFTLSKKKRSAVASRSSVVAVLDESGSGGAAAAAEEQRRRKDSGCGPLVIPLPPSSKNRTVPLLLQRHAALPSTKVPLEGEGKDAEAAAALIESASPSKKRQKLVIPSSDEWRSYRDDIRQCSLDLSTDSPAYVHIPVADFGAAMLRGMGWKNDPSTDDEPTAIDRPRHHRLGLGALPLAINLKQRRQRDTDDKQLVLQKGSIVRCDGDRRAEIVQWLGVPGLNRVLLSLEQRDGPQHILSLPRQDVRLISRAELDANPFSHTHDNNIAPTTPPTTHHRHATTTTNETHNHPSNTQQRQQRQQKKNNNTSDHRRNDSYRQHNAGSGSSEKRSGRDDGASPHFTLQRATRP